MELENIKKILETISYYKTVSIKQVFTKNENEEIEVRCQQDSEVLEIVCRKTNTVSRYSCIEEAAVSIAEFINSKPST